MNFKTNSIKSKNFFLKPSSYATSNDKYTFSLKSLHESLWNKKNYLQRNSEKNTFQTFFSRKTTLYRATLINLSNLLQYQI